MRPEYIFIQCPQCERVYQTHAAISQERLLDMMPVLRLLNARCPFCEVSVKIGEATIESPRARPCVT
jgi:endogenous inhibitor of DNA gyrase (YacG/DUF329 family)